VLYIGIAKDVDARFEAHVKCTGAIFTRLNRPVRILGKATTATKGEALRSEYAFKQVSRADKLQWCATGPGDLRSAGMVDRLRDETFMKRPAQ
jgi:putative endonuclease